MARKDKGGEGGGSASASPSHSRRAHSQPHSSPSKNNGGNSSSPNGNGSGGGGRSKGVPQSFGYIKRQANGAGMASNMVTMDAQQHLMLNPQGLQQQQQPSGNRSTAQVSAVPRGGKIKMIPGANQTTQDLHASKWHARVGVVPVFIVTLSILLSVAAAANTAQNRSFSLTGPGATQLSQSIRERLATSGSHSLPKPGTDLNAFQYR